MRTLKLKCFCGKTYLARMADIKRGWATTCSKSCAGIKREYGRPNAIDAMTNEKIKFGKKRNYMKKEKTDFDSENEMYEAMCDNPIEGR